MEKNVIVDENDNVIGAKPRKEIKASDIFRVSGLWIENSKGEILFAQRAFDKKFDPGKWDHAATGTVAEGETYEETIIREAEEELGLKNLDLILGPKQFFESDIYRFFAQMFIAVVDKDTEDFTFQKSEVVALKWLSKDNFLSLYKEHPEEFVESMGDIIPLMIK